MVISEKWITAECIIYTANYITYSAVINLPKRHLYIVSIVLICLIRMDYQISSELFTKEITTRLLVILKKWMVFLTASVPSSCYFFFISSSLHLYQTNCLYLQLSLV